MALCCADLRVNISLVWVKKPVQCGPLGVIGAGPSLGWTEDCSVFWGSCRLGKLLYRLRADAASAQEYGGGTTLALRMLTKWF